MQALTETELRLLNWGTLKLAAIPAGPAFVPAVVAILHILVASDGVRFGLSDERTGATLLKFAQASGWTKQPPGECSPVRADLRRRDQVEVTLPSAPGHVRGLGVWRDGASFASAERLLLECFLQHVTAAWGRQSTCSDELIEYAWSSVPFLHVTIDRLGHVEIRGQHGDACGLLADWQSGASRPSRLDEHLRANRNGVLSLSVAGRDFRFPRTIHGWMLAQPDGRWTDIFFWEGDRATVSTAIPSRDPVRRASVAELDRVARIWGLSSKQRRVVEELVTGKGNKDIASALGCAEVTVEYHLAVIRRKVGADGRAGLIALFWIEAHRFAGV